MSDIALRQMLASEGYTDLTEVSGRLCGLHAFLFTTGFIVGLDEHGYELRYCYEHADDARTALLQWNGVGHPSGPWIKAKGLGADLLNPGLTA